MNNIIDKFSAFLLFIIILIGNISCKDNNDDDSEVIIDPTEESGVNAWIESTMRENYLWYADMPTQSKLNFSADPETFFSSLLSTSDGNEDLNGKHYYYSYIESTATTTKSISSTDYSYGFEFTRYYDIINENDTIYYIHLLYVAPGSPASDAGLKRGDWIIRISDNYITSSNYRTLYGSGAMKLSTAQYNSEVGTFDNTRDIEINAARTIEDDPIHLDSIYISSSRKKVGYLVYNHFTAGQTDEDTKYNKELLSLSNTFKGVDEFILDLRYNNGGLLSSAQLLSTILAPASALGKTFCTLQYNNKQSPQTREYKLQSNLLNGGANLDLKTIYILVTAETASASELVINCLKPYMKVVVIGEKTEGKNVASVSYPNDKYSWLLQPIVGKLYNANSESEYGKAGFTPDYECNEIKALDKFLPFGDTNELLLSTALSVIDGTYTRAATKAATTSTMNLKKVACSLDRKASNGVIIR